MHRLNRLDAHTMARAHSAHQGQHRNRNHHQNQCNHIGLKLSIHGCLDSGQVGYRGCYRRNHQNHGHAIVLHRFRKHLHRSARPIQHRYRTNHLNRYRCNPVGRLLTCRRSNRNHHRNQRSRLRPCRGRSCQWMQEVCNRIHRCTRNFFL